MQHHHLTSTAHARNIDRSAALDRSAAIDRSAAPLMRPADIGERDTSRSQAGHTRAHLTLASPPAWRHKLILTGTLDRRTAADFEDEIECLCEEGVTTLALDLRQLGAIDATGARSISLRGAACKSRGRDFTVLSDSPAIHNALAEAGAEHLLADDPHDTGVLLLHLASNPREPAGRDISTAMIKHL